MIVGNHARRAPSKRSKARNPHDAKIAVISCHQLIEFCCDYIDGELPDDEQLRFRRHLSACPDCVTFFETYKKTPEVSRQGLPVEIPISVKEAVRTFLQSRKTE
jgi:anti-sigma factor RsiW